MRRGNWIPGPGPGHDDITRQLYDTNTGVTIQNPAYVIPHKIPEMTKNRNRPDHNDQTQKLYNLNTEANEQNPNYITKPREQPPQVSTKELPIEKEDNVGMDIDILMMTGPPSPEQFRL